jgi:hypothetical protein
MHEQPTPLSHLSPDERILLIKLIDTTASLAEKIERRLPRSLKSEHFVLEKLSPSAWQSLFWRHQADLAPADREALSLRASLADVSTTLRAALHQIEQSEKTTPPNLTLKRQKRVEL